MLFALKWLLILRDYRLVYLLIHSFIFWFSIRLSVISSSFRTIPLLLKIDSIPLWSNTLSIFLVEFQLRWLILNLNLILDFNFLILKLIFKWLWIWFNHIDLLVNGTDWVILVIAILWQVWVFNGFIHHWFGFFKRNRF